MPLLLRLSPTSFAATSIRRATTLSGHFVRPSTGFKASNWIAARMSSSIPTKMKGVVIEKAGGIEVLQYKTDLPVPEPKAGQVLVKNDYVGINFIDT